MFNHVWSYKQVKFVKAVDPQKGRALQVMNRSIRVYNIRGIGKPLTYEEAYQRVLREDAYYDRMSRVVGAAVLVFIVAPFVIEETGALIYFYLENPTIASIYLGEVANDIFNPSMPPSTPHGAGVNILIKGYEYVRP